MSEPTWEPADWDGIVTTNADNDLPPDVYDRAKERLEVDLTGTFATPTEDGRLAIGGQPVGPAAVGAQAAGDYVTADVVTAVGDQVLRAADAPAARTALGFTVDTTVGTRVFVGEQMVYGSVTRQILQADLVNGWTTGAALRLSREGNIVTLHLPSGGLNGSAKTANVFFNLPAGFRPDMPGNYGNLGNLPGGVTVARNFFGIECSAAGAVSGVVMWRTAETWPT
ncbi:hypothetical protein [Georgenia wangjunii]|uniref:hypothetical protein n=1 Tax=Georgenia wangjunii TaxID=3117730 RepID=UPI002F265888